MSYESQMLLEGDPTWQGRCRACAVEQATQFNDGLSELVRKGDPEVMLCFARLNAGGPGVSDKVETPSGIDQSQVPDAEMLALTQSNWPIVGGLYAQA